MSGPPEGKGGGGSVGHSIPSVADLYQVMVARVMYMLIIIMSVFLERLFMSNMLSCAEQVHVQKYKTHAYMTPKTACVQTILLKHPTKQQR